MKKALKDLYYGRIDGLSMPLEKVPQYRKAQHKAAEIAETLKKHLDKEEKRLLMQYSDLHCEMETRMGQADFIHGFRVGARMMAEVFCDLPDKTSEEDT